MITLTSVQLGNNAETDRKGLPWNAWTHVFTRRCLSSPGAEAKLPGVSMMRPDPRAVQVLREESLATERNKRTQFVNTKPFLHLLPQHPYQSVQQWGVLPQICVTKPVDDRHQLRGGQGCWCRGRGDTQWVCWVCGRNRRVDCTCRDRPRNCKAPLRNAPSVEGNRAKPGTYITRI